jgi:putative ABC transport system permease protein
LLVVDPYYFNTFGIDLVEGRAFEPNSTLDQRESIILNQAAADYFGLNDPVGKKLPGSEFGPHRIIGVTNSFNYASLHTAVEPLVITMNPVPIFDGSVISDLPTLLFPNWFFNIMDSNFPG